MKQGQRNALKDQTQAKFQQALQFHQSGQLAQAQLLYDEILQLQPLHFESLHLSGVVASQTKNFHKAVELIGKAIEICSGNAFFYSNYGNALKELRKYEAALSSYDRAIALKPDFAEAWNNRGVALYELQQYEAAVASYDRAIVLKPDYAEAWNNRGNALNELKHYEAAVASYDRAIALNPDYAEACSNRGVAFKELRQYEAAVSSYDRAIALKPDYAEAWNNRGNALTELKQQEAALASYERAITLKPDYAEAWNNRGNALQDIKQYNAAAASYERAISLNPDYDFLFGQWLYTKMKICDWISFDHSIKQLVDKIELGKKASSPFPLLALVDSPALHKHASEIFSHEKFPLHQLLPNIPKRARHKKIRIGYYSADYRHHPMMYLMADMFEKHDRDKFEVIAFSFGPDKKDEMRKRVAVAFDRFIDVRNLSDTDVANLSRSIEIDIAIDLGGFTADCRTGIFALRAAPIQVNYLGYPGTMGADYIDYLIADATLIPALYREHYTEKIVSLPDSYQVNDATRRVADKVFTREELGLPPTGFVFCCFNNNYKITPATLDGWIRILKKVEGSVLWLLEDNPKAVENLRTEAVKLGIQADRLIFAKRLILDDHLARHQAADLFLDTLPYNAHTTASDALWAGLPVLTCIGESFASRVAASLLNAIHLPELITSMQEEYEALAIELATNPEKLSAIRKKLDKNRLTTPLFDTKLFTRHIEEAYTAMYERYQEDLPPEHIVLPSSAKGKHALPTKKLELPGSGSNQGVAVIVDMATQFMSDHSMMLEQAVTTRKLHQTQAKFQQALQFHQSGQLAQAQLLYDEILQLQPLHFESLHLSGVVASQTKNFHKAVELIGKAIEICSGNASFYSNYGNALKELRKYEAALSSYDRAIALKPDFAEAWNNRGVALYELQQYEAAVASYDRAIVLKPDYGEAFNNRGNTFKELKQYESAVASYDRAIALKPAYAEACSNRGVAFKELRQYEAAVSSYDRAIALKPDYAEAWNNRGNALTELKQREAALASYDRAITLKPDYAEAWNNRGNALTELKQHEAAVESYDRAIMLKSDYAEAYSNRGNALKEIRQYESAIASYERAISLNPDYDFLLGQLLHTKMKICDWSSFDQGVQQIAEKIELRKKTSSLFSLFSLIDSPVLQKNAVEIFVHEKFPSAPLLSGISKRERHKKIRIGYYSADYHNHATAYLMAELFEKHDREKFELIAFSFGPDRSDEMRERSVAAFDRFLDVRSHSDREVALLSRELEIDIAVDLKGFTQNSRVGIFAFRAAPIQVNYLGYPGTMGADYIDYLIADATLIPEKYREYYTEKIVSLPDSYQVNDAKRCIAESSPTRTECGLPEKGFVFCCFNNNYKITPATLDGWMRILKRVEGSVLWLLGDNQKAADNLRQGAVQRGVERERLIFVERMPLAEHLARHQRADLFLDTYPCNAHTTASDALWAGLPVLTLCGESFAARVAASLLNAIQLPELITSTQEEYETLAIELASNPQKLTAIRQKLERNRLTTPLFDTKLFTRHIESAYTAMYERYQEDLPPEHIVVLSSANDGKESLINHIDSPEAGSDQGVAAIVDKATSFRSDHATLFEQAVTILELNQTQAKFQQAFQFHQSGQLAQAQQLYDEILQLQPRHFDSLHLSGVVASQTKNFHKAVELIGKAIEICPGNAVFHSNYGNTLKGLKQHEAAVSSYDLAIALKPDFAEAWNNRGNALYELKQYNVAIASYDRAIFLKPDYAEAHYNRGNALKALKRYESAVASYDLAIALKPDDVQAHYNRGNALQEFKQYEAAVTSYDRVIALKPDFTDAIINRGVALYDLQQYEAAVASYDRAIVMNPDCIEGWNNRGNALKELKQHEAALASYDHAISLKPDYAEAFNNRGVALKEIREHEAAVVSYDRAIALKPEYAEAYWNKSITLLLAGDFDNGWELYEWRWINKSLGVEIRNFLQPLWSGKESLAGKTILLHTEQGFGDTIQFCRYVRLVADLCCRVVFEVEKPLAALLQKLDGISELVVKGSPLPQFDYHCPLLSLPLAFKTDLGSVPNPGKYIRAEIVKQNYWAAKLGEQKQLRVGIVWSGSEKHKNDHNRSILLADMIRFLPPHFQYVSLQKKVQEIDKSTLQSNANILHFGDELHDFTDTAALCELMDLVISVDTSVAHLSGAMGKETWVLLPFSPDWRWLLDRDDSPWYQSLKLYRQQTIGDWESVLAAVKADLEARRLTTILGVS